MPDQDRDPLIEEALRWHVVLRDGSASERDRLAFDRWRATDPAHEAAWRRAQDVWTRLDGLRPAFTTHATAIGAATAPRQRISGRRRWLQAAAVGAVAVPSAVLLLRPDILADHRTAAGERRTVQLDDGSTVELAGDSALSVAFDAAARRVRLLDGEAYFTVAPEARRPFTVEAGRGRIEALGTAFDVKRNGAAVIVAVASHSVAVSIESGGRAVVGQGQKVRYTADRMDAVQAADLGVVEAWRRDRLIFQDAPLGEVIADLERCRGGRILMTDSRLSDLPVTAVFDTRQTDAALATIASTLPIRVRHFTDFLVVLSPRD